MALGHQIRTTSGRQITTSARRQAETSSGRQIGMSWDGQIGSLEKVLGKLDGNILRTSSGNNIYQLDTLGYRKVLV